MPSHGNVYYQWSVLNSAAMYRMRSFSHANISRIIWQIQRPANQSAICNEYRMSPAEQQRQTIRFMHRIIDD